MCQIILKHTSCMFTREARSGVSRQWMMYAPKSPPFPETSWVNLWNWLKGITIRARTDGYLSRTSFFPSTKERSWSSISILGSYLTMKQVGPQSKRKLVSLNRIKAGGDRHSALQSGECMAATLVQQGLSRILWLAYITYGWSYIVPLFACTPERSNGEAGRSVCPQYNPMFDRRMWQWQWKNMATVVCTTV